MTPYVQCTISTTRGNNNPVEIDFPLSVPSESEAILSDDEALMNSFRSNNSQISVGSQSNVSEADDDAESDTGLSKD